MEKWGEGRSKKSFSLSKFFIVLYYRIEYIDVVVRKIVLQLYFLSVFSVVVNFGFSYIFFFNSLKRREKKMCACVFSFLFLNAQFCYTQKSRNGFRKGERRTRREIFFVIFSSFHCIPDVVIFSTVSTRVVTLTKTSKSVGL